MKHSTSDIAAAVERALDIIEAAGLQPEYFNIDLETVDHRTLDAEDNMRLFWMHYTTVNADLKGFGYAPEYRIYSSSNSEEVTLAAQKVREAALFKLADMIPDSVVVRYEGTANVYFEENGVGISLKVGNALCERVQTGTRVEKKRDQAVVDKLLETIPAEEVEVPVFAWKCNDAELLEGKI